jgi:hypothetical protein
VKTANVKDAGTDDAVMVRLGNMPGTWVDLAINDRERGQTNLYDLGQLKVGNRAAMIRDIRTLTISKTGSDGWSIESLELIVNGRAIYRSAFPGGRWLDNSKGKTRRLLITSTKLRTNSRWELYKSTFPSLTISRLEMEQRVESIIGHHIHTDKRIQWGKLHGRGVEVSYKDSKTLQVDLDLMVDVPGPNVSLDVDFDIRITTRNGAIDLTVTNLKSRIASNLHKAILAANGFAGGTSRAALEKKINEQVRRSLGGRPISVSTGKLKLSAKVTSGGDVRLGL